MSIIIIQSILG